MPTPPRQQLRSALPTPPCEPIPLCDLGLQHRRLGRQIEHAIAGVVAGGRYILGPNVRALERDVADYLGCRYAVGVGSGTDALHLALRALRVGPGDEVITTPFTFIGTTEAICLAGATPVFVDIDPLTFNLDAARIEAAITPRTRAVLPVHLYGRACRMDAIAAVAEAHGLHVVEDCAQAIGASFGGRRVGGFGKAGCLSFFPSKNLGALGDGGMIVTNDAELFRRAEMLRRHGGRVKYHHTELGLNSRLDELQAAVLRVKLPHLEAWNRARREHAAGYHRRLAGCGGVAAPGAADGPGAGTPVYHQYTIRVADRDAVAAGLRRRGIGTAVYYPVPLHLQEVHRGLGYAEGDFPHAEHAARECLALPMFPELTGRQLDAVAAAVRTLTESSPSRRAG